ncbi:MAG: hypothetical protein OEL78_02185, partial [Hyphomicrobiales bacterium]|nr:hypothetical protein [Hyphomicrobiales bacterium]
MAMTMPRNRRVTGSPGGWLYKCALLPLVALAATLVILTLTTGAGLAQEAAGEAEPSESEPGLRVKSVILPGAVSADP